MKVFIKVNILLILKYSQCFASAIFGFMKVRGDMNFPIRVIFIDGTQPFPNTSFTCVNFLTAANEANNDRSIGVTI